jgi:hypothetical protein
MSSEVACLIGGKDLKLHVTDSFRKSRSGFEKAWFSGISEGELF